MRYLFIFALVLITASCQQVNEPIDHSDPSPEQPRQTDTVRKTEQPVNTYDQQLSEYALLIAKYKKSARKAKNGDVAALSECASICLEAKDVENKLLNSAQKLSLEQQKDLKELYTSLEKINSTLETVKK